MWNGVKARFVRVAALVGLLVAGIVGMGAFFGCGTLIAVYSAPRKQRSTIVSEDGKAANQLFWDTLHGGRYDDIGHVLNALTAAYLKNPGDAETAAHIGFAHIWRVGERARLADPPATITDDLVLAQILFRSGTLGSR